MKLLEARLDKNVLAAKSATAYELLRHTSGAPEPKPEPAILKENASRGRELVEYLVTGEWNPSQETIDTSLLSTTGYARTLEALAADPWWRDAHEAHRIGQFDEYGKAHSLGMPTRSPEDREAEAAYFAEARRKGRVVPDLAVWRPDAHLVPLVDALLADFWDWMYSPTRELNTRVVLRRGRDQQLRLDHTRLKEPALPMDKPVVVANATGTADSLRLLLPGRKIVIHKVKVPRHGKLVVVADHLFSKSQFSSEKWRTMIVHLLRSVLDKRKADDRVIGWISHSEVFNALNRKLLAGEEHVPQGPGLSSESRAVLRAMTLKRGYVSGYHGGVAGSNSFADDAGRFVGMLFVFGPPILPLEEWATNLAPIFAGNDGTVHGVNEPINASLVKASIPFPGYRTKDGKVVVANNIPMPSDARLTELAWEAQAGSLEQSNGRARLYLPQNADSVVYQVGGYPTGEAPDEIITFEEMLKRLGVDVPADLASLIGERDRGGRPAGYDRYAEFRKAGMSHADAATRLGPSDRTGFRWKALFESGSSSKETTAKTSI